MSDYDDLAEQGRKLASEREDLLAAGADPADLVVPLHPRRVRRFVGRPVDSEFDLCSHVCPRCGSCDRCCDGQCRSSDESEQR